MGSIDPRSLRAVINVIRGQHPAESEKGQGNKKKEDGTDKSGRKDDGIVSRRDEKGMPYRGDFPNPASDRTRGCF